jgi:pyruvate ferredoxin oxidoreductase gamma subunit
VAAKKQLPIVDHYGFYEIRFDSIGGLGAHVAGQILGEAAVLNMGLNALHFSSYGSEKKGSPIKSFVRFAAFNSEIRSCSPVERPHMVAVFHDALLRSQEALRGLRKGGTLIVNTRKHPSDLGLYDFIESYTIYTIDALTIAIEEKSRVNTAMLGAVTKVSGFLDRKAVQKVLNETFARKHPSAVASNERTFERGYNEIKLVSRPAKRSNRDKTGDDVSVRPGPQYGYRTAPIGGIITMAGNSVLKDVSTSRQGFLPLFDAEKCVLCGLCDLVCPDHCLVWRQPGHAREVQPSKVKLVGVDYRYCKGCLRCAEVCPSGALSKHEESEDFAAKNRVEAFPELSL